MLEIKMVMNKKVRKKIMVITIMKVEIEDLIEMTEMIEMKGMIMKEAERREEEGTQRIKNTEGIREDDEL